MKSAAKIILIALLGVLCLALATNRTPIYNAFLQSDLDGNQKCITNLSCIQIGDATIYNLHASNFIVDVQSTNYPFLRGLSNLDGSIGISRSTNADGSFNADLSVIPSAMVNQAKFDLWDVLNMNTNAMSTGAVNVYWIDCGKTNGIGQRYVYGTLTATNDCQFPGVTNAIRGSLYSFNIVAYGGNRTLYFPTSFPHFDTNGSAFFPTNSLLAITLTNGNELRFSVQSNSTLSTLWCTFGQ